MEDVVIRFRDVHKSFGAQHVLDGLSFEVTRGRTLGIMGASGSGKSVALRHAIGLMKPDSGLVEVDGQEVARLAGRPLSALSRWLRLCLEMGLAPKIQWKNRPWPQLCWHQRHCCPVAGHKQLDQAQRVGR
jgi:ABC-type transporter Mla maintaining outer membrane lipid asymmetry ATPase subunit MlaF